MPAKARNAKTSQYNLGRQETLIDLEVPSGAMCQVRRPGPVGLITAGLLDDIDIIGSVVQTDHVDRVEGRARPSEEDEETKRLRMAQELMGNKDHLLKATRLIEGIVCHVVVQPELHPSVPPEERDPERIYIDSVDFEDQVFIFQFAIGGSADIATFRQEFGKTVGSLAAQQDVSSPSEPAVQGEG